MIVHEDILDNIVDEFSFLKDKSVDVEFVTLARDYRKLVWLLVEAVAVDDVFVSR